MKKKLNKYRINHEKFIGFTIGQLTVYKFEKAVERKSGLGYQYYYKCLCTCGNLVIYTKQYLVSCQNKNINCSCKKCNSQNLSLRNKSKKPKWSNDLDKKIASIKSEYTTRAVKKQIDIDLEMDDFKKLCLSNCYYCNISANDFRNTDDKPRIGLMRLNFNGIDRVDNTKGYTKDNVVSCCEDCNKAKRNLKQNDFLNLISQIYKNRILDNETLSKKY